MRSDAVKKGMQQAPHRSLFNALGLTEEEMQMCIQVFQKICNNANECLKRNAE